MERAPVSAPALALAPPLEPALMARVARARGTSVGVGVGIGAGVGVGVGPPVAAPRDPVPSLGAGTPDSPIRTPLPCGSTIGRAVASEKPERSVAPALAESDRAASEPEFAGPSPVREAVERAPVPAPALALAPPLEPALMGRVASARVIGVGVGVGVGIGVAGVE